MKTLTKAEVTATYVYNALGQLIKQSGGASGTVLYMYDDVGHLVGEYSGSGSVIQETVWLGDMPITTLRPNGASVAIYYVHTDHLNTPVRITRPSDNMLMWTWYASPFGVDSANDNPSGLGAFNYNLRFPGQLYDEQARLHYNYLRDYDPAVGRYVEPDPLGLVADIAQYDYVSGNPISGWDPWGLADQRDLGGGFTGRLDHFNTTGGQASFELHVYKGDTEVGVLGPNGWINKHGHVGPPANLPETVNNACNGIAVDEMRRAGHIPAKGRMNIKGGGWKKILRGLPWLGPLIEATQPSNDRKCALTPNADGCYLTD
jgi:RHS repeat-associated protein